MGKAEFAAALRGIEPWLFAYYQNRAREEAQGRQETAGLRREGRVETRAQERERRAGERGTRVTLAQHLLKNQFERRIPPTADPVSGLGGPLAFPPVARAISRATGQPEFEDFPTLPLARRLLAGRGPLGEGALPRDLRVKAPAPKPLTEFQKQSLALRKARDKATADLRADAREKKIPPGVSENLRLANGFDADAREFRVQQQKLLDEDKKDEAEAIGLEAQRRGRLAGAHREAVKRLLVGLPANVTDWVIVNTTVESKGFWQKVTRGRFGKPKIKTTRELVEQPFKGPAGIPRSTAQDPLGIGFPRR